MGSSNSYHKSLTSTTGFPPYSEAERKLNSEFWRWIFFCSVMFLAYCCIYILAYYSWHLVMFLTSKKSSQRAMELTEVRMIQAQVLELDQELHLGSHRVVPWSPLSWAFPLPSYKNPPPSKSPAWKCSQRKIQWTNNKFLLCCTVIFQQREDIENFQRDFHYRLIRRPSVLTAFFPLDFLPCTGSFPSNNCNFFWHFLSFFTIRLFSSSVKRQRVSYGLI